MIDRVKNVMLSKYVRCEKSRTVFCRVCQFPYTFGDTMIRIAGMGNDFHVCPGCAIALGEALVEIGTEGDDGCRP